MKPKVYDAPIPTTDSSVQSGNANAKNNGKHKMRFPHPPLTPDQGNGQAGKMKRPAYTPGGPSGS